MRALPLPACSPDPVKDTSQPLVDADGDGYTSSIDCDGADPAVGDPATWYADADGDGFGDAPMATNACDAPTGSISDATDCDDADPAVNPAAAEVCNDTDDDCDGGVDEDAADASTWYLDKDSDGFGDPATEVAACTAPTCFVADPTDCDDTSADTSPDAAETCNGVDDDCDGTANGVKHGCALDLESLGVKVRGDEESLPSPGKPATSTGTALTT